MQQKRKRRILTAAILCAALVLSACGGKVQAAGNPGKTEETPTPAPATIDLGQQKAILEENRDLWAFTDPFDSPWYYTFTDLDHNGRLEVIAATTQGSGIYTYAHFYEVLPDGSGIGNCYHENVEIEGPDDWPEIILESLPCYYDRANDRYYYACEGITREGVAYQHYSWQALCLKDGVAEWEVLAYKDVYWDEQGTDHVSCQDDSGNPIEWTEYDSAVERRFAGMERSELSMTWAEVEIPWTLDAYEEAATQSEDYATAYEPIFEEYRKAYASEVPATQYAWEHGISEIIEYSTGVGYALEDLDNNGIPELIVAGIGTDEFADRMAYGVYTLEGGVPVNLATSSARMRYYLRDDGTILYEGSGGAAYTYIRLYRVNGSSLEEVETVFTNMDGEGTDNPRLGYYRQQGYTETLPSDISVRITEEEFYQCWDQWKSNVYVPPLTVIC